MSFMRTILIPIAVTILLALSACTPSPKYRARPPEPEPATSDAASRGEGIPTLSVRLLPPVRDFHIRRITSAFGSRSNPRSAGSRRHDGIDIKATAGEEIIAAAAGVVVFAGRQRGYGNVVIIDHGGGTTTLYAHLFYARVRRGESVAAGETIGRAGKRGSATGTHLHFEVRHGGTALDPAPYL